MNRINADIFEDYFGMPIPFLDNKKLIEGEYQSWLKYGKNYVLFHK